MVRPLPVVEMAVSGVYKPSSVLDGHLSRPEVAIGFQRSFESMTGRHMRSHINLAPGGVYMASQSPGCR